MHDFPRFACLVVAAMGIDFYLEKVLSRSATQINNKEKEKPVYPHIEPKTRQTYIWRYSDLPNSLLFDFSKTSAKLDDIQSVIKQNIPSKYSMNLVQKSSSAVELGIVRNDDIGETLYEQLLSILRNKGLYIENDNIWLKPTLTISRQLQNNFFYWKVVISDLSREDIGDEYTFKIRSSQLLHDTFKNLYNENLPKDQADDGLFIEGDMVFVDMNQIYFEEYGTKRISVHLLVQEMKTKNSYVSMVNPSRQLIYVPFLQRYAPIKFSLIQ